MTLSDFLLDRVVEDQASLKRVAGGGHETWKAWRLREAMWHIVVWFGPANENDDRETYDVVLRALAAVYADHPDYDPTWATE